MVQLQRCKRVMITDQLMSMESTRVQAKARLANRKGWFATKTAAELFKSDASVSDNCYIDCVENSETGDEAETLKTKRPRPQNIISVQVAAALDLSLIHISEP